MDYLKGLMELLLSISQVKICSLIISVISYLFYFFNLYILENYLRWHDNVKIP